MRSVMPLPEASRMRCSASGASAGATTCSSAAKSTARHSARWVAGTRPVLSACRRSAGMAVLMLRIPARRPCAARPCSSSCDSCCCSSASRPLNSPPIHCVCCSNSDSAKRFPGAVSTICRRRPSPSSLRRCSRPSRCRPSSRPLMVARVTPARSASTCGGSAPPAPCNRNSTMKRPSLSPCGASRAAQSRSIDEDSESSWKHRRSGAMLA